MFNEMPAEDKTYAIHEESLEAGLGYLRALADQPPTTLQFKTGSGHIFFEFMKKLPSLNDYENEKIALCKKIASLTYPLADRLMARGVAFTITIADSPQSAPLVINTLATVIILDALSGQCRHCFMDYKHKTLPQENLSIPKGMTIVAEPIEYHYHQLKDDRVPHPRHAGSALPSQEWYNRHVDKASYDAAMPTKAFANFGVPLPGVQGVAQPNELKVFKTIAEGVTAAAIMGEVLVPAPSLELPKGQNYFEFQPRAQRYWRHQLILEQARKETKLELSTPKPQPTMKNPSPSPKPEIKNNFKKFAKLFPRLSLDLDPYQDN